MCSYVPANLQKSATLLEVASLAGVSASTVSNVLNGKMSRTSEETRARVLKAVEQLSYAPNRMARGLKTGFVSIIGLIVPSMENPFWGAFAHSVERVAARHNCQVMFCNGERNLERESLYAESMLSLGIRGLILGSSLMSATHLAKLTKRGLKIMAFDRMEINEDGVHVDSMRTDNTLGMRMLVEHLLGQGHRRIAIIPGYIDSVNRVDRIEGYKLAMRARGIEPMPEWIWYRKQRPQSEQVVDWNVGYEAAMQLLKLSEENRPTAYVGINDMTALGALAALHEKNIRVPQDASVAGFDGIFLGSFSNPPLTTVKQPLDELMKVAVPTLIGRLDGSNGEPPLHFNLAPELVVRASSGLAP